MRRTGPQGGAEQVTSPYRLAQEPEAKPTIPWYRRRPVWWRKLLWRYTKTSAAQHQPRRQTLGGRWVLVYKHRTNNPSHYWWYPLMCPYFGQPARPDDKWGTPIEIEDWT